MAAPKEAWGIDVGQVALKAVKLRELGDKVEAVAYEYIEHPKILSQAEDRSDELVRQAIQKFLSRNPVGDAPVAIGVPGHHTLARFTKLPPVDEKKVPDIVKYEAEQQIPFDLEEVMWDYQILHGQASPELEVGIFAMKRDLISSHLAPFLSLGVEPTIVQSCPLAIFNALVYDGIADVSEEKSTEGTVMLDIGAVNSDLVIGAGNGLWTRTIQIGGNSFTEALIKVFKLSFGKAEALKRTASTSNYRRQLFQAMRPVFADLVAEVQRSLGFYGSTRREVKVVRLIGMGGAFKMPGLQRFVEQNLGIEVVKPETFHKLMPTSGSHPKQFQENLLGFGVAYGLALQGLERTRVTSNLLPSEITRQRVWRKKNPWFAAAAACLLLASGIIWARHFIDKGALASNIGEYTRVPSLTYTQARQQFSTRVPDKPPREYAADWLAIARALDAEMKRKTVAEEELSERLARYGTLQKHKNTWLAILDAVHGALPNPSSPADEAGGAAEPAGPAKEEQRPRIERKEIYIDEFESMYFDPDIIGLAIEEIGEESADFNYQDENFAPPGFKVRMKLRCPNKDSRYVDKTFIENLREFGRQPNGKFYFDFIKVTDRRQIRGSSSVDYVIDSSRAGTGAPFGRRSSTDRARTAEKPDGAIDPVTGESIETDWRLNLVMVVILGEPPREDAGEEEPDRETPDDVQDAPPPRD